MPPQRKSDFPCFLLLSIRSPAWDHHKDLLPRLKGSFRGLNRELRNLIAELKASGVWDNVVIIQTSDFARTLAPNNGGGTDHGYGGISFIAGGGVKGKRILGEYPSDFRNEMINAGRGRLIPTMPWDSPFNAIAEWMGVNSEDGMDRVVPSRHNFNDLLRARDLFE